MPWATLALLALKVPVIKKLAIFAGLALAGVTAVTILAAVALLQAIF